MRARNHSSQVRAMVTLEHGVEPDSFWNDSPGGTYAGGLTLLESIAARGYDVSDLGTLAAQVEGRTGRTVPDLPPVDWDA